MDTLLGDSVVAPAPAQFGEIMQNIQSILIQPTPAPPPLYVAPVATRPSQQIDMTLTNLPAQAPNVNTPNIVHRLYTLLQQQQGIMAATQSRGRLIDGLVPKLQQLVDELPSMSADQRQGAAEDVCKDNQLQQALAAGTMSWNDILAENSAEPSIGYAKLKTLVAKLTREGVPTPAPSGVAAGLAQGSTR
jgi:hypothetical protein